MKVLLVIWLLSAGIGVSYSVISERKKRVEFLGTMEQDLKKLAYYMCEWRLPVEEAVGRMLKEGSRFGVFYEVIHKRIREKYVDNFEKLWCEESKILLSGVTLSEEIKILWRETFSHLPMEPEAVKRQLYLKSEMLSEKRRALEEKYKGEQRLVLSMGFFVSAFLCLILW